MNSSEWNRNYWYTFIQNSSAQHLTDWGRWMRLVGLPLVLLIGFPGNAMSILVMNRRKLRCHSYSVFLTSLSIFDTCSLVIRTLFWINLLRYFLDAEPLVTIQSLAVCKLTEYLFTSIHIVCSWLVAVISMERSLVVWCPIKSRQWCTVKSARRTVILLVASAFILEIYSAVLTEYDEDFGCAMSLEHTAVHFIIATTFVTFAPLILIFLSNILIIACLFRSKNMALSSSRDILVRRATYMLLAVSCTSFILVVPNALVVLLMGLRPSWTPLLGQVLEPFALLWDFNFGINFYIYVLAGVEVRNELKDILKSCTGASSEPDRLGNGKPFSMYSSPSLSRTTSPSMSTVVGNSATSLDKHI